MSTKSLPFRAPLSKIAPRRRTPVERIFGALEAAAAIRALTRLTGRGKQSKLPTSPALLAAIGGGIAAIAAGAIFARKRSSGGDEPLDPMAPGESPTSANGGSPEASVGSGDPAPESIVAPGADAEAAKLDVDAPNEGATGDHPA